MNRHREALVLRNCRYFPPVPEIRQEVKRHITTSDISRRRLEAPSNGRHPLPQGCGGRTPVKRSDSRNDRVPTVRTDLSSTRIRLRLPIYFVRIATAEDRHLHRERRFTKTLKTKAEVTAPIFALWQITLNNRVVTRLAISTGCPMRATVWGCSAVREA